MASVARLSPKRAALGASFALAPPAYHLARGFSELRAPEPEPHTVLWTERSAFLERLGLTGFAMVVTFVCVAPWLARRPTRIAGVLRMFLGLGAVAGVLGGAFHR